MKRFIFAMTIIAASTAWGQIYKPSPEAAAEFTKAMEKMHHAMPKPSDQPDRAFVDMMIPHHQAAIDMAETELKYGQDSRIKALAKEILTAQRKEIQMMEKWRSEPR